MSEPATQDKELRNTPQPKGEQKPRLISDLDGPVRYEHFIKAVADGEEVWVIRDSDGGLVLLAANDNPDTYLLPLWPTQSAAELHLTDEWANAKTESLSVYTLLDEILPDLQEKGLGVTVFPNLKKSGVLVSTEDLAANLQYELKNY